MAKDKYTVTVGPRAYSFHDQSTGITVCRGEDKELSRRQFRAPKIQKAIASGHLIIIADKSEIEKYSEADIEKLDKRLNAQFKKGMTLEKARETMKNPLYFGAMMVQLTPILPQPTMRLLAILLRPSPR